MTYRNWSAAGGGFQVRASKGIHLVVSRDRIHADTGIIMRTERSVLFVIPWGRHWLIGTTDTEWNLGKAHPAASRADIDYLLQHINTIFTTPVTHQDVEGVYASLWPLLAGESEATSKLSREHRVAHPVAGLTVIAGGKYTTYRVMDPVRRAPGGHRGAVEELFGPGGVEAGCLGRLRNLPRLGRSKSARRSGPGRIYLVSPFV